MKYHSDLRKHRHKLVTSNRTKKQCSRVFIDEKVTIKVIMDCKTTYHINLEQGLVI